MFGVQCSVQKDNFFLNTTFNDHPQRGWLVVGPWKGPTSYDISVGSSVLSMCSCHLTYSCFTLVWIDENPSARPLNQTVLHDMAAQVKAATSNPAVSPQRLRVTTQVVTDLDRTAGVGHKPPRRLSGTFLLLFWSQKRRPERVFFALTTGQVLRVLQNATA